MERQAHGFHRKEQSVLRQKKLMRGLAVFLVVTAVFVTLSFLWAMVGMFKDADGYHLRTVSFWPLCLGFPLFFSYGALLSYRSFFTRLDEQGLWIPRWPGARRFVPWAEVDFVSIHGAKEDICELKGGEIHLWFGGQRLCLYVGGFTSPKALVELIHTCAPSAAIMLPGTFAIAARWYTAGWASTSETLRRVVVFFYRHQEDVWKKLLAMAWATLLLQGLTTLLVLTTAGYAWWWYTGGDFDLENGSQRLKAYGALLLPALFLLPMFSTARRLWFLQHASAAPHDPSMDRPPLPAELYMLYFEPPLLIELASLLPWKVPGVALWNIDLSEYFTTDKPEEKLVYPFFSMAKSWHDEHVLHGERDRDLALPIARKFVRAALHGATAFLSLILVYMAGLFLVEFWFSPERSMEMGNLIFYGAIAVIHLFLIARLRRMTEASLQENGLRCRGMLGGVRFVPWADIESVELSGMWHSEGDPGFPSKITFKTAQKKWRVYSHQYVASHRALLQFLRARLPQDCIRNPLQWRAVETGFPVLMEVVELSMEELHEEMEEECSPSVD
jgi:hypothetical protein